MACRRCGTVKQERLDFLADNPFYTKRFAYYVGRRCRAATIQDVAHDLHLDWHTVKALEKQYMREQLRRVGTPGPTVIGIDEVSIKRAHTYCQRAPKIPQLRSLKIPHPQGSLRGLGRADEAGLQLVLEPV